MLLLSRVPINGSPNDILAAMKQLQDRCDEFVQPIGDTITVAEINRVLNSAQKTYRLIDIIAPKEPLKIVRFDNSHVMHNSECAIYGSADRASDIFLYHLRETTVHDRVFIFAHELGHALHKALTGDVSVKPDGFDELNAHFSPKPNTEKENQEYFADAVAFAILNAKGLGSHFPSQFNKDMSYIFAKYVRGLCENALKKTGNYSEPLPPPNSPWGNFIKSRPPR